VSRPRRRRHPGPPPGPPSPRRVAAPRGPGGAPPARRGGVPLRDAPATRGPGRTGPRGTAPPGVPEPAPAPRAPPRPPPRLLPPSSRDRRGGEWDADAAIQSARTIATHAQALRALDLTQIDTATEAQLDALLAALGPAAGGVLALRLDCMSHRLGEHCLDSLGALVPRLRHLELRWCLDFTQPVVVALQKVRRAAGGGRGDPAGGARGGWAGPSHCPPP